MGYASQLGTFSVTIKKKLLSLIFPILICSILSGVCCFIIYGYFNSDFSGGQGPPPATPIPGDDPWIAALNALFYVGIAFIGAFIIFLIFKYGKIKLLKALFAFAIAITSFFFIFLFVYAAPYYFLDLFTDNTFFRISTDWIIFALAILFGIGYALLTIFSMVFQKLPPPMPQIMAMLFAVLAGTFLATFLPMFASIFVMIGLSIYDIISVFKGPIKKIAEVSEKMENDKQEISDPITTAEQNNSLDVVNSKDETETKNEVTKIEKEKFASIEYIELGLGDLAFFGMLFSFALIRLGFFAAMSAFIGVIIGAMITIKLLEKVGMMPGLPLSIGLGLLFSFGVWGILALGGYEGWGWIAPDWFTI